MEYIVTQTVSKTVTARNELDAENKFSQMVRDGADDQYKIAIREVKPWEDDDLDTYWWVALTDLSVAAPSQDEAFHLAKDRIATGEADIEISHVVSQ